jgi:hypothetical protein
VATIVRDAPPLELLSSSPRAGTGDARSGRNANTLSVGSMLTVGGGGRQLGSEVVMAYLQTPEDAGIGHAVASYTMRAKLVGVPVR